MMSVASLVSLLEANFSLAEMEEVKPVCQKESSQVLDGLLVPGWGLLAQMAGFGKVRRSENVSQTGVGLEPCLFAGQTLQGTSQRYSQRLCSTTPPPWQWTEMRRLALSLREPSTSVGGRSRLKQPLCRASLWPFLLAAFSTSPSLSLS